MASFITFVVLLIIGFGFGRWNERRHFKDLARREDALADIRISQLRKYGPEVLKSEFVAGNVVISIDYFKRIAASLRALVGGRVASYTSLLERARREAVLRMKEKALAAGYTHIANVRVETSSVFQNAKSGIGSIECYAYGTALR